MSQFTDSDLETDDDELDETFNQAADQIMRTHATHMPNDLLELYALYKQATVGQCNTPKPGIFKMQNRAKWSAWHELGDMTSVKAKSLYVEKVQQLDPKWHENIQSDKTKKGKSLNNWVVHSIEMPQDEPKAEHEKTAFDYVKEGNLVRLRETVMNSPQILQQCDEYGMGLIHWASDRNAADILRFLIEAGVDVNFRDADQQTALHYAASCAHLGILRILLNSNADRFAKDIDGHTSLDVAENGEVRALLKF